MADFDNIALTATEVAVMAALQGILSSSLIINPTSDTNIPVNSKRFVDIGDGSFQMQNWNGSAWAAVQLDAHTIQGLLPTDIDYSAGDGIDIDGSNVISVEAASESNVGGVQLAADGDDASLDKAISPGRAKALIDASVSPINEVVSGQVLNANGKYMLPADNNPAILLLPDSPPDGTVVRVFSRDASQGIVAFLSSGTDDIVLDDADPKVTNTVSGTITATDNFDVVDSAADFSLIDWSGYRVTNITDGSVGLIESVAGSNILRGSTPILIGGTNNIFTVGDSYTVDGKSVYIPAEMEFGLCELIYRDTGSFQRWTYSLTGNSDKSIFVNPAQEARNYLLTSGSLFDVLKALDTSLNTRLNVSNPFYRTASYQFLSNFSGTQYDICVSATEIVATMIRGAFGGSRHIANFGSANVVLRVGENAGGAGTTSSVLAVDGILVAASATDIIVPPGAYAVVHRRNDENGSVDDNKVAYVTGSTGCTKA